MCCVCALAELSKFLFNFCRKKAYGSFTANLAWFRGVLSFFLKIFSTLQTVFFIIQHSFSEIRIEFWKTIRHLFHIKIIGLYSKKERFRDGTLKILYIIIVFLPIKIFTLKIIYFMKLTKGPFFFRVNKKDNS